ncbi:MAG: ribonuclease P protein component [Candidatus Niyogibacteria bacterium CG10_big_fil_rev_8_21_14_0_10_42_19]|uniref:Ribonuclease P protein component n=1 Tax=Candidatus Niyogibacteria bacterium CG10_big_fil_rev_8_21_14_0_10_42_19 TaxID=1974725 RepID=A0A2H0TF66_9BACT|nr:MAG: ribonuclease P protein component [Candidatus Niyogibacteria bacterium CG10_big_fil_rev_8_21_14_0_10_42_19]
MTLPKKNRITSKEIKDIFKNGRRLENTFLSLIFIKNKRKTSRLTVVIPSKIIKSSVNRNKIRRRSKETFRKTLPLFESHYDVVVLFHKNPPASQEDFYDILKKAFKL